MALTDTETPNAASQFQGSPDIMSFAHSLADIAAVKTLRYFRQPLAVDNKTPGEGFDPVTVADRTAEQAMRERITTAWPDHGIAGEELGVHAAHSRYTWVLDPIDGTRAYVIGMPIWGTLIGLLDGERPVLGIMDQPFMGERFWSDGRGSYLTQGGVTKPLAVRPCPTLKEAILTTTDPQLFANANELDGFARLKAQARMTRYGGDCYHYCLLAMGFIDLIVESGLKPHDIMPLIPIIERAGGCVTTWDGQTAIHGGRIVAAGDARVHQAAMKILVSCL